MKHPIRRAALAVALLAAGLAHAGQIVVPDDAPTLQQAIDMAAPGDVILLRTSAEQGGVTVTKPLTIVGDPIGNVNEPGSAVCPTNAPGIRLAGPGHGTVTLVNLFVGSGEDCFRPPPALEGGGFDELHILDSRVIAPIAGKTGQGYGSPGIRTSVPYLFLARTTVRGSNPDVDYCAPVPPGREAGIQASASTVVLVDCDVKGGETVVFCCMGCGCPTSIPGEYGTGGDGVICDVLFRSGGSVLGGKGATYFANNVSCGLTQPDGAPWVANGYVALPDRLTAPGSMHLGGTWSLAYVASSAPTFLFASLGTGLPTLYPGTGWSFGDPATTFPVAMLPPGTSVLDIPVPPFAFLIGVEVLFQLADAATGSSEPELAVIVP